MIFDDHLAAIVGNAGALLADAEEAALSDPVPTCPGWTVANLLEHHGGVCRWATAIVGTGRATNLSATELQAALTAPTGRRRWRLRDLTLTAALVLLLLLALAAVSAANRAGQMEADRTRSLQMVVDSAIAIAAAQEAEARAGRVTQATAQGSCSGAPCAPYFSRSKRS